MNIIKLYDNTELDRTVVAVGNFDGVHIGHAALIEEAVRLARENGCSGSFLRMISMTFAI